MTDPVADARAQEAAAAAAEETQRQDRVRKLLEQAQEVHGKIVAAQNLDALYAKRTELFRKLRLPENGKVSYAAIGKALGLTGEAVRWDLTQAEQRRAGNPNARRAGTR